MSLNLVLSVNFPDLSYLSPISSIFLLLSSTELSKALVGMSGNKACRLVFSGFRQLLPVSRTPLIFEGLQASPMPPWVKLKRQWHWRKVVRWTLISNGLRARCKKKVGSDCTKCRMYRIIASGISCTRFSGKHHTSTQQVSFKPPASAGNQPSFQATKSPFSTWSFRWGKNMKQSSSDVSSILFCLLVVG